MSREWKPGDVGMAIGGYAGLVFRCLDLQNDDEAQWMTPTEGRFYGSDDRVRPLVVIDPEDREQVKRLHYALFGHGDGLLNRNSITFDDTADAIRSLVAPPRPEEPTGLGAVVEDEDGKRWVRRHDDRRPSWVPANDTGYEAWSDIAAVRVLSEGVAR